MSSAHPQSHIFDWPKYKTIFSLSYGIAYSQTTSIHIQMKPIKWKGIFEQFWQSCTLLQIRDGIHIIFFLFLHKNICCGYSLEAPCWGASNEYPQHMFSWRNKKHISTFLMKKKCLIWNYACISMVSWSPLSSWILYFLFINRYWRSWSDCVNVQADSQLCYVLIPQRHLFSHIAAWYDWNMLWKIVLCMQ